MIACNSMCFCIMYLQSLAERNNRLLKEKKMLLMTNKTEIERLEKERVCSPYMYHTLAQYSPTILKNILGRNLDIEEIQLRIS